MKVQQLSRLHGEYNQETTNRAIQDMHEEMGDYREGGALYMVTDVVSSLKLKEFLIILVSGGAVAWIILSSVGLWFGQ